MVQESLVKGRIADIILVRQKTFRGFLHQSDLSNISFINLKITDLFFLRLLQICKVSAG